MIFAGKFWPKKQKQNVIGPRHWVLSFEKKKWASWSGAFGGKLMQKGEGLIDRRISYPIQWEPPPPVTLYMKLQMW